MRFKINLHLPKENTHGGIVQNAITDNSKHRYTRKRNRL